MSEEQQLHDELHRSQQAELILKNPLVKEVLDSLEKDIISAWENTPMRDAEAREKAWMYYLTVRKFRNTFINFIETGRMASMQLETKRKLRIFGGR